LLVGQGSVGKTSLVKPAQQSDRIPINPNESQTDGLTVRDLGRPCQQPKTCASTSGTLVVKRFTMPPTNSFSPSAAFICWCANCRTSEDENRIEYWLKLIQSFGGKSPVIIVGNKKDEQPFDINRKALRQKYPNICAILETSCQSGDGIEALRQQITEEVGKLHDVYNLLPLSWFRGERAARSPRSRLY
jgi:internalin A